MAPLAFVVVNDDNSKSEHLVSEAWMSHKNPIYPIDLELALQFESELERIEIVSYNRFPRLFSENNVGIVEVKVFGKVVSGSFNNPLFGRLLKRKEKGEFTSELQEISRKVKMSKERSVQEENFQLAKQAQMAERLITKAIDQINELEKEKLVAVKKEDYQRAADLRQEMQTMRTHILASIDSRLTGTAILGKSQRPESFFVRPENLFEKDEMEEEHQRPRITSPAAILLNEERKIKSRNSERSPHIDEKSQVVEKVKEIKQDFRVSEKVPEDTKPPASRKSRSRSVRSLHSSRSLRSFIGKSVQPVNKFMEKENMVVPAISKKGKKIEKQENSPDTESSEEDYLKVVGSKDQAEATRAVRILGEDTVFPVQEILRTIQMNKILSRKFDRRQEGIKETKQKMQKSSADEARQTLDVVIFVLSRTLKDSLFSVYNTALSLLRSCTLDFMPKNQLLQQSGKLADAIINSLLTKLSPTATDKRTPRATEEVLLEILLSDQKMCRGFLPKLLAISPTSKRVEVVSVVAEHYGAPNNQAGISEEVLRNYAGACLISSQNEVRSRGRQLILRVYGRGDRRAARNALPTESRRASLVEGIIREMDVIDRKGY